MEERTDGTDGRGPLFPPPSPLPFSPPPPLCVHVRGRRGARRKTRHNATHSSTAGEGRGEREEGKKRRPRLKNYERKRQETHPNPNLTRRKKKTHSNDWKQQSRLASWLSLSLFFAFLPSFDQLLPMGAFFLLLLLLLLLLLFSQGAYKHNGRACPARLVISSPLPPPASFSLSSKKMTDSLTGWLKR